jgi:hypothetical protein
LTHTEPTVLNWDWNPGSDVSDTVGLLVIIDSQEDPIPEANKKVFDIEHLVITEKHIGLRKLNVINI